LSWDNGTSDPDLAAAIAANDYKEVGRLLANCDKAKIRPNVVERLASDSKVGSLRAFLEAGWSANGRGNDGAPLVWAAKRNQLSAVTLLLENGADPNLPDSDGSTPLVTCCKLPSITTEVVELLLRHGADPARVAHIRYPGSPPVMRRVTAPKAGISQASRLGPNVPYELIGGMLPLEGAVSAKRCDVVRLLIKRGAKFDPKRYEPTFVRFAGGIDFQFNAMRADNREIVALLLDLGVDVDAIGDFFVPGEHSSVKCTALFAAAAVGNKPMVELLLRRGANPKVKASDGRTPIDFGVPAETTAYR
jgi:ankyrin repeat protein